MDAGAQDGSKANVQGMLMAAGLVMMVVLAFGPVIGISDALNAFLSLFAGLVITILHGKLALGWKRLTIFLVITVAISFTSEALGVATGLIFGRYHYTDNLGPKILGVPMMIQVAYVSMGYASLMTARVILDVLGTPRKWNIPATALCGGLVMVAWDVAMDPYQSTVAGDWIWEDGGGYFGVPIHNYFGWFATVFLFMFVYLCCEARNPLPRSQGHTRLFWSIPVFYYAITAFTLVISPLVETIQPPIASPQNYTGSLAALMQSLALIAMFAMGTPAVIAFLRLAAKPCEE